jgi:hypothetical protein
MPFKNLRQPHAFSTIILEFDDSDFVINEVKKLTDI